MIHEKDLSDSPSALSKTKDIMKVNLILSVPDLVVPS